MPYAQGGIKRLVPLGKTLMCYMENALFVGLPSNDVNLPVAFQRYETGGRGLAGPRAICSWGDKHFLAMQDNLYSFSLQEGLKPIGDRIARKAMQAANEDFFWKIRVAADVRNRCILFEDCKSYIMEFFLFHKVNSPVIIIIIQIGGMIDNS